MEDVKWMAVEGGGGGGVVLIWPVDWTVAWFGKNRQKDETQGVTVRRSPMGDTDPDQGRVTVM